MKQEAKSKFLFKEITTQYYRHFYFMLEPLNRQYPIADKKSSGKRMKDIVGYSPYGKRH